MLRRSLVVLVAVVTVAVAGLPNAWAVLITPVKVIGGPGNQWDPFASSSYLAYSSNSVAKPSHWDVFVRDRVSGVVRRANPAGTIGFAEGFDPGTNVLLYQQIDGGQSDLVWYDADTHVRTPVSGASSSKSWEYWGRVSSSYVLFLRDLNKSGTWYVNVYVLDRSTGHKTLIKSWKWSNKANVETGSVGDRYAMFDRCTSTTCTLYLWDDTTGKVQAVPTKNGRPQYTGVLNEAADAFYFVRSGFGCGKEVGVFEASTDLTAWAPVKIASMPAGIDVGTASIAPDPTTGGQDLLFTRIDCAKGTDIYSLPGVTPPPAP